MTAVLLNGVMRVAVSFGGRKASMTKTQLLYDLLLTLQRKEICLEIEGRMYRGDLVYVGDPRHARKSYVTIKDVLDGNTRVSFKDIRRVWYLNRILWNDVTGKEIKRTFFIP
jgi:hypothetical protein